MDMTGHNTPTVNLKPFIFNAKFPTIEKFVSVFISDKYIYPVDNGKTNKIKVCAVVELVLLTHSIQRLNKSILRMISLNYQEA